MEKRQILVIDIGTELYTYQKSRQDMDPMESIVALEAICADVVNVANGGKSKPHYGRFREYVVYRSLLNKIESHIRTTGKLDCSTCLINGDDLMISHS